MYWCWGKGTEALPGMLPKKMNKIKKQSNVFEQYEKKFIALEEHLGIN